MGAKQRIMGACGCGEEKGREVEKTGKESWFKGSAKDVKKAKEAGAVVVSGKCAKTTAPIDCPTKAKEGDNVWFKGSPKVIEALKAAGVEAPKAADATEAVELEKAHPAPVVPAPEVAADAGAAEDAAKKPEDAAKPAEAASPAEEAAPAAVE